MFSLTRRLSLQVLIEECMDVSMPKVFIVNSYTRNLLTIRLINYMISAIKKSVTI